MRKDMKHPYTKGYTYWAPIISEWINSPMYTDKAKDEFIRSLDEMQNDRAIASMQPGISKQLLK